MAAVRTNAALFILALVSRCSALNVTLMGDDAQTDVTKRLNQMMAGGGTAGIYKGGKGIIARAMNDGITSTVVPTTLLSNDIISPSSIYPDGNPMCPNNGWSGWNSAGKCGDDPFGRATMGIVVGTNLPKLFTNGDSIQDDSWGYGVFYGSDANAADQRCRWVKESNGYDCPGGWLPWSGGFQQDPTKPGAGGYASGNPTAGGGGGGAGCHFSIYDHGIDQFDAVSGDGKNLVQDQWCQCNYNLKSNWWQDWVKQWMTYGKAKTGFEWMGWFGKGKAPSFGLDIAACWVNNPRDMIQIQNALYWFKDQWNNQLQPQSTSFDEKKLSGQRRYWGWNEIPLDKSKVENAKNWDAVLIKLPPAVCGHDGTDDQISCLTQDAQQHLEALIGWYVDVGHLKPGLDSIAARPGSYVVFMKEWYTGTHMTWERGFFCNAWSSPGSKFKVVYAPIQGSDKTGKCYLDWGSAPSPPPPPPPPPSPPAPIHGKTIVWEYNWKKCIDVPGGDFTNGKEVQIWDCNGGDNQVFARDGGSHFQIKSASNPSKCFDAGADMHYGNKVMIWDCNGQPQQRFNYNHVKTTYGRDVGTITVGGKCVHLIKGDAKDGNHIEISSCFCGWKTLCSGALWLAPSKGASGHSTLNISQLVV